MPIYIISELNVMRHKITLPQLKKYDITQKVIMALADAESRVILFSIIRKGKTASDLSVSLKIPLSSVYKKLSDLEKQKYPLKNQNQRFHYLPTNYYEGYTSKTNTTGT